MRGRASFRRVGGTLRVGVLLAGAGFAGVAAALAVASPSALRTAKDVTLTDPTGKTFVLTSPPVPSLPPRPAPAIGTSITAGSDHPLVGQPLTLTVVMRDDNVSVNTLTETIDGFDSRQLQVQSAQSDIGPCSVVGGTEVSCPFGKVNADTRIGAQIVVIPQVAGTFTVTASVPAGETNNGSLAVTVAAATADVALRAPAATLAPRIGRTARAGIVLTNAGPLNVDTTTLSLTLPRQVRLVAAKPQSGTCDLAHLTCQLGALADQSSVLVVLTFKAASPGKGQIVVRAGGDIADSSTANNQGTIAIDVPKPVKR